MQLADWSFSLSCTQEKKKNKGGDEKQMCLIAGGLISHLCRPLPHACSARGKHITRGGGRNRAQKGNTEEKDNLTLIRCYWKWKHGEVWQLYCIDLLNFIPGFFVCGVVFIYNHSMHCSFRMYCMWQDIDALALHTTFTCSRSVLKLSPNQFLAWKKKKLLRHLQQCLYNIYAVSFFILVYLFNLSLT